MKLSEIYKCFSDETRLRILSLLSVSPLCVCHIQAVLNKSQVVISQHLAYLKKRGLVAGQRYRNWMLYALPSDRPAALEANLSCLKKALESEPVLRKDAQRLAKLMGAKGVQNLLDEGCCARIIASTASKSRRKLSAAKQVSI